MKLPRLVTMIAATAALTLTACGSGTTVGGELDTSIKPRETETTKKPTDKPTDKPSESPSPTRATQPTGPKPEDWQVFAKDGNGYDPLDMRARVGDVVVFENQDVPGSDGAANDHSWTIKGHEKDGGEAPIQDSGVVKSGNSVEIKIALEPGIYDFYCTLIPYMVGGKIAVYA